MKYLLTIILLSTLNISVSLATEQINTPDLQNTEYEEITQEEAIAIATLENDILLLDNELKKCEKKKKGWIAATVIGSVGVVSTGTAAAIQGAKIHDQNEQIKSKENAQ